MDNSSQILPRWVLIGAAVLCFVAIADLPYGFYRLVRWVACGVAIASAVQLYRNGRIGWVWTMGVVALVFNPIFPFYFPRSAWMIFDAGAGACFFTVFWQTRPTKREANKSEMATPRKPSD